jgi:hypothetical protein
MLAHERHGFSITRQGLDAVVALTDLPAYLAAQLRKVPAGSYSIDGACFSWRRRVLPHSA